MKIFECFHIWTFPLDRSVRKILTIEVVGAQNLKKWIESHINNEIFSINKRSLWTKILLFNRPSFRFSSVSWGFDLNFKHGFFFFLHFSNEKTRSTVFFFLLSFRIFVIDRRIEIRSKRNRRNFDVFLINRPKIRNDETNRKIFSVNWQNNSQRQKLKIDKTTMNRFCLI